MLTRNTTTLLLIGIVSILCYQTHRRTRDALVVADALNLIDQRYIDPVDHRQLLLSALDGMTKGLDPYSEFVPLDQYQELQSAMSGEFAGIGIYVDRPDPDGPVSVITPLVGSPALQAGLMAGDKIVEIDGQDVSNLGLSQVSSRLKGIVGTTVAMVVLRDGRRVDLTVRRGNIQIESVVGYERLPDQSWSHAIPGHPSVAYARLTTFGEKTPDELNEVLEGLSPSQTSLILDLRGNGGGLLDTAVAICDLFLAGGVVVSTEVRGGTIEWRYTVGDDTAIEDSMPVVVMVDHNSASASEIVAAALQDRGRATIVGTRSFGKGTVQNVLPLETGRSALKLTVARYLRPSGANIHRGEDDTPEDVWGVSPQPNHVVPLNEEDQRRLFLDWRQRAFPFAAQVDSVEGQQDDADWRDPQLMRAVEVLVGAEVELGAAA